MASTATVGVEPATIDLVVHPGEPVDFTVPVFDAGDAAVTPTGWTLTAPIRRRSTLLGSLTATAVTGGVRVAATGEDTTDWADWAVSQASWTLWVTPPAGQASPLVVGAVRVHHH